MPMFRIVHVDRECHGARVVEGCGIVMTYLESYLDSSDFDAVPRIITQWFALDGG